MRDLDRIERPIISMCAWTWHWHGCGGQTTGLVFSFYRVVPEGVNLRWSHLVSPGLYLDVEGTNLE